MQLFAQFASIKNSPREVTLGEDIFELQIQVFFDDALKFFDILNA